MKIFLFYFSMFRPPLQPSDSLKREPPTLRCAGPPLGVRGERGQKFFQTLFLSAFLFIAISSMFFSCATQQAPGGGPKDTIAPKLVRALPDTFSTNFHSNTIEITFDEYFQVKNLNEQLVVSPPLSSTPEIKIKNKTMLIHFEDTLKKNKTYTFNFGTAISDGNENNAFENFQYVFSTGAEIDSEKVFGKVVNAQTLEPEKNILVMLYDSEKDSLPYLEKPSYFGKTKADGTFSIKNIAHGSYKLFALKETNNNYLFDSRDESIAFARSPVYSSEDSVLLKLFTEALPQRLLRSSSEESGKVVFIFQQPVESLKYKLLSPEPGIFATEYSTSRDTIFIWYKNTSADSLSFKITSPVLTSGDTVVIKLISQKKIPEKKLEKPRMEFKLYVSTNLAAPFNLNDSIRISFSHPIAKAESAKISLIEDSATRINFTSLFIDSLKRKMFMAASWKENKDYKLEFLPGVFTDTFGLTNDTVQIIFHTRQLNEYGSAKINLKIPENKTPLILQLMDEKENVFRQSYVQKDTTLNYEYLSPGIYRLKIIVDENGNGKWDTGNYLKHIQPEKVFYNPTKINVRANWDIETDWNISELRK